MKYGERAKWLKFTKEDLDPTSSGKKKFLTSKNTNSVNFIKSDEIISKRNVSKIELPKINDTSLKISEKIPRNLDNPIRPELDLEKKIKQKESEIVVLKNLYSQAFNKLEKMNTRDFKYSTGNKTPVPSTKDILLYNNRRESPVDSFFKRDNSMSTPKPDVMLKYAFHPAFAQPKYTKTRPKIIITSPITGVSPIL
jgi:hypothetical protein